MCPRTTDRALSLAGEMIHVCVTSTFTRIHSFSVMGLIIYLNPKLNKAKYYGPLLKENLLSLQAVLEDVILVIVNMSMLDTK